MNDELPEVSIRTGFDTNVFVSSIIPRARCISLTSMRCFFCAQINPLPRLPVPLGIGQFISEWLGMRVGVSDINLHGRVRINMRPLMAKLPIVGGVQVYYCQIFIV